MKALVWDDADKGEEWTVAGDPRRPGRRGRDAGATGWSTCCPTSTTRSSRSSWATRRSPPPTCAGPSGPATIANHVVPVLCGSAFKNKGVQPMLDAVVDYLPSPVDIPPTKGIDLKGIEELERPAADDEPFSALAFKIMSDPHVGKLTYIRVYSGKLAKGRPSSTRPRTARSGSAASCRCTPTTARTRTPPSPATSSPSSASRGPPPATRSATRTHPIVLEALDFPEPVIHVAVEPKTKADQDKLSKALQSLSEEDPTFQVRTDEETGQTVISGMGELHLEVLVDRMLREFRVDANVGKPQVAYRETIRKTGREGRGALHPPDRWPRPVRPRRHQPRADRPGRRLRVRRQDHRRRDPEGVHPLGRRRHPGRHAVRRAGRLPGRRHPGHADLRLVPRRRLLGDGVQDRRVDVLQEGGQSGPARCSSSRSWPSRWSRPRTTWAT